MKTFENWLTFVDTLARARSRSSLLGLLTASLMLCAPAWAGEKYREPPDPPGAQAEAAWLECLAK